MNLQLSMMSSEKVLHRLGIAQGVWERCLKEAFAIHQVRTWIQALAVMSRVQQQQLRKKGPTKEILKLLDSRT